MDKIKTTHVGSLPRSNELSELLFKKDKEEKIDINHFDKIINRDVKKIVKKQKDLGIDFVSDGEMSKISYATYVKDRLDGFSGESERKAPKDLDDFPSFKERVSLIFNSLVQQGLAYVGVPPDLAILSLKEGKSSKSFGAFLSLSPEKPSSLSLT